MEARQIIKTIMVNEGVTNAQMANRLNISQATVWDRLNNKKGRKDIPTSLLDEMLKVLDYKIVIVPYNKRVLDGEYEVE